MAEATREDLLRDVAIGTAGTVADGFLTALVQLLGEAYGPGACWLSEVVAGGTALRSLASWPPDTVPPGETHLIAPTPCVTLLNAPQVLVERDVAARFPDDPALGPRAFTGYAGFACPSTAGEVVGVLEIATADPLTPGADELLALRIFASWVGEEIERRVQQAALTARENELLASRMRVVEAADDARRRIGRDLHDGVQQRVLALKLLMEGAFAALGEADAESLLRDAIEEADTVGVELRELARGLHPTGLAEYGLTGALERLARRSAVPLVLRSVPDRRAPAPIELTVYYLVSEAVTNTAKYAPGATVTVDAELGSRALRVVIADDGPGGADAEGGSGLRGLQDRIAALGGTFAVDSPRGGGTTLTAEVPLTPFRHAQDPFLEFGLPDDGGAGEEKIRRVLAGELRHSISLAAEWDLEGGPPRIGSRIVIRNHAGERQGDVYVTRVAVMPLDAVDQDLASEIAGKPVEVEAWRTEMLDFWDRVRPDIALLLDEPDWRIQPDQPMVIVWFEPRS